MITTTEKKGLRKKLLHACIAKQQFLLHDFTRRIRELTSRDALHNNESYDQKDIAAYTAQTNEINTLHAQLEFAKAELDILEKLYPTCDSSRNQATLGAVVVTDHYTLFVSASLEKFTVEDHPYIGISTLSPIYKAMEGKTKGDTFSYNNVRYKIKDIF
jgi:hypothetical protein